MDLETNGLYSLTTKENGMTIEDKILSEERMIRLFGGNRKQLRLLTLEDGLPAVRLMRGWYVYRATDVIKWINKRKRLQDREKKPIDIMDNKSSVPLKPDATLQAGKVMLTLNR